MNAPWFRCHADAGDIKVVWRLADFLRTSFGRHTDCPSDVHDYVHNIALGLLASFWGKASRFAPGGDISGVSDGQIEEWAKWRGKPGLFAGWVREHHVTDGRINDYEEFNGVLDARRERDRIRKQDERKASAGRPKDVRRTSRRTIRDDTKRKNLPPTGGSANPAQADSTAIEAPGEAAEPTFKNWVADYGAAWEAARLGTAPFGRIGSTLKRLIDRDGPAKHYPAWLRFVASEKATYGPEHFANNLVEFTTTAREREQTREGGQAFDMAEWQVESFLRANRDRAKIGSPVLAWEDVYPECPRPARLRETHAA